MPILVVSNKRASRGAGRCDKPLLQVQSHTESPNVTTTIYGIKNCDTMKKARAWLDERGIAYAFHDYKADGIDRAHLDRWDKKVGWQALLNRAGTTFRALQEEQKQDLDTAKAIALMLAHPSMIKRPVLDLGGGRILVGFKPEIYSNALLKGAA
jgi:arsenate reductase (glutaredoxin)